MTWSGETKIFYLYLPCSKLSSKKEIQYVQFLTFQSNDNFIHAFSPFGQIRFKTSCGTTIPDAVNISKKIAFYFNGCHFHSHDPSICKINKKGCPEKSMKKLEEFKKKTEKLCSENEQIDQIEVMWECEWDQKKKTDSEVKTFMRASFIDRPVRRLVPRKARK